MNIIQHNLTAAAAANKQGINATNFQKNAKRLGSGYRINSAADDAAGLSISEKMRAQIRALNRGTRNAEEGANFMQTGDGAMHEAHSILDRMGELTVQSLNDTNTPEDRAALAAEFEQLQCEIDRINHDTYFNNIPVFEQHSPSYYQIAGNRVWAATQHHSVLAPDNTLNIHLPADIYDPADYVVAVPSGIYTTQELIDEIDSAIMALDPKPSLKDSPDEPYVPGFVFEYTDFGYCNLNFESDDGLYTEISSVDGALAYLLYGTYDSNSVPGSLLGTTAFVGDSPLTITAGQNDTLTFYVQSAGGLNTSGPITLTVPAGEYKRTEMIDKLNELLEQTPGAEGLCAAEYGNEFIQITGGPTKSVTGLKGNMFKIEYPGPNSPVYSSIFYDNIDSGYAYSTPASFTGAAYYNPDYTKKIVIDDTNDTLKFKVNKDAKDYIEITLAHNPDGYTIPQLYTTLQDALKAYPDVKVGMGNTYRYESATGTYVSYNYLTMSSAGSGSKYEFQFDTGKDVDSGKDYGKAFNALFEHTEYEYYADPTSFPGSDKVPALLVGKADFSSQPININAGSLTIDVDGIPVNINVPAGPYTGISDLLTALNNPDNWNPADMHGKITFVAQGNVIAIQGSTDVNKIDLDTASTAYEQLFTREGEGAKTVTASGNGTEAYVQGTTAPDPNTKMASATLKDNPLNEKTTITASNNRFSFYLNGSYVSVTIDPKEYSREDLIKALNDKFNKSGLKVQASLTDNCLTLTTTPTGTNKQLSIYINTTHSSGWQAIVGTETTKLEPSPMPATALDGTHAYLQGSLSFANSDTITLNNDDRKFNLTFNGVMKPIELTAGTYDIAAFIGNLQTAVDAAFGPDQIDVKHTASGCIRFEAHEAGRNPIAVSPTGDNTFYRTVLQKYVIDSKDLTPSSLEGRHSYDNAFIVGRSEIKEKTIEIVPDMNDTFTVDLNYPDPANPYVTKTETLNVKLPAGFYTIDNMDNKFTQALKAGLDAELNRIGVHDIELLPTIGPIRPDEPSVDIKGVDVEKVLHILVAEKTDANGNKAEAASGSYQLDGIRGNASYTLFYKTAGTPTPVYLIGSRDVSKGVTFTTTNNELSITVDGTPYTITYPQNTSMTAEELVKITNELLSDPNVNAPIEASLENGRLKFTHKEYADQKEHSITDVRGSAAGTVFYATSSRDHLDAFMLQVGALGHQGLELPRFSISTAALGINSITITRRKYANKALGRLSKALDMLSAKRSTYGALTNRIDHVVANNKNTSENAQASESRIRDANMAKEMVELTKHRILTEASQAMLAQANQTPNGILTLLQI